MLDREDRRLYTRSDWKSDSAARSMRATVEGLKLGEGVTDRLAAEGEKSSLRYDAMLII